VADVQHQPSAVLEHLVVSHEEHADE
jgi:hypothetical protein